MVAKGNEPDDIDILIAKNLIQNRSHNDTTNHQEPSSAVTTPNDDHYGATTVIPDQKFHADKCISMETISSATTIRTKNCNKREEESTYWDLLATNRPYRLYFMSNLVTMLGEWFTYVACLSIINQILPGSYTAVSFLIVLRLLPPILLTMFGGTLADGYDRRLSMIALDSLSTVVSFLMLLVLVTQSLGFLYVLVFVQASLAGLYEPVKFSIIPMLVPEEEDMKKATTLTTIAWSVMAAFGASAGGVFVGYFGIAACFICDALTFMTSAVLMGLVGGEWNAAAKSDVEVESIVSGEDCGGLVKTILGLWEHSRKMFGEGISYLWHSFFGPLVFVKASGGILYGAGDILNVAFAETGNERSNSIRMGILFSCVGVGCIIGPLVSNRYTDMKRPETLQVACITGFAVIATGFFSFGLFESFVVRCFFTMVRSSGAAIMWTDSSILLQKFCDNSMLGRVSAVDYGLATLAEGASAVVASILHDRIGLSAEGVSFFISSLGFTIVIVWSRFHISCGGAASPYAADGKGDDCDQFEIVASPNFNASKKVKTMNNDENSRLLHDHIA